MKRLIVLPLVLIALVIAIPFFLGNHPVGFGGLTTGRSWADVVRHPGTIRERYPVATVKTPWLPGATQFGVHVYWEEAEPAETQQQTWLSAQQVVNYVVGLGSNAIAISFPFYTSGPDSSEVAAGPQTPSPAKMALLVHEARLAGLRTTLRPILDERTLSPTNDWRGGIRPASKTEWFVHYRALLAPYLRMAQAEHVDTFILGVELNSIQNRPDWSQVIADARSMYGGELSYDANYDRFVVQARNPAVDSIGIDAYFPVKLPNTATAGQIAAAWNGWLDRGRTGPLPDILFSEVGIVPRQGAFRAPANYERAGILDARIQPTWYEAVCEVARERHLTGIYFWKTDFGTDLTRPTRNTQGSLDFTGYPLAEQAIRQCFATD
jgi:hypothetical protein